MINWDWPQYVLAFWWIGMFFMMVGVQIVKPASGQKVYNLAVHWIYVLIHAWLLYMGGFWS